MNKLEMLLKKYSIYNPETRTRKGTDIIQQFIMITFENGKFKACLECDNVGVDAPETLFEAESDISALNALYFLERKVDEEFERIKIEETAKEDARKDAKQD